MSCAMVLRSCVAHLVVCLAIERRGQCVVCCLQCFGWGILFGYPVSFVVGGPCGSVPFGGGDFSLQFVFFGCSIRNARLVFSGCSVEGARVFGCLLLGRLV